jgi:hypothetical protein
MKLNIKKCKSLYIKGARDDPTPASIIIDNTQLEAVASYKYLNIQLNTNLIKLINLINLIKRILGDSSHPITETLTTSSRPGTSIFAYNTNRGKTTAYRASSKNM